ncbi:MAG TPA: hypothetical protein VFB74_02075 [Kribbellaceae bacterium]|nr:hypothetical protein [Kribbellaceae bacterium]
MRYGLVVAVVLALGGCEGQTTTQSGGGASATPGNTPTTVATTPKDFDARGLGAYVVGAKLADLRTRGLVRDLESKAACPGVLFAKGTTDEELAFVDGELRSITVRSPQVLTTRGARVGMPVDQVQAKYPDAATLNNATGGLALLATSNEFALLFRISTAGTVESIEAGTADTLEFGFTADEGC